MIYPTVFTHTLHRHDLLGVLNDTYSGVITRGVRAYGAYLKVGEVLTNGAKMNFILRVKDSLRKALSLITAHVKHRKSKAHCGALAHTCKSAELLRQNFK